MSMEENALLATNRMCNEIRMQNKELKRQIEIALEDIPRWCRSCAYRNGNGCPGYATILPPEVCINWKWRGYAERVNNS